MKQKQNKRSRNRTERHYSVRRHSTKRRIRIGLHPISVMTQLCVGVLLVMSTFTAFGDASYSVTATVPAAPLTDPAVITSPTDGAHISVPAQSINGTCPVPSYVKVYQNSVLVGVSTCTASGTFSVSVLLDPGANQLLAQDYNITDMSGPSGTPITVTYDVPVVPNGGSGSSGSNTTISTTPLSSSNVVSPVNLQILQVDNNVPYSTQSVPLTTETPVITGVADPYSAITVVIHSNPIICKTTADANGFWRCAITQVLPVGNHTIQVTSRAPDGSIQTTPIIKIQAIDEIPVSVQPPSAPSKSFAITTSYNYQAFQVNENVPLNLIILNGVSPYAITINWGDGNTETVLRASTDISDITHTYGWINASEKDFTVKIQATDTIGQVSAVQLMAVVRNPAYTNTVSSVAHYSGLLGLLMALRAWLWLLWPAYIIIILMLISFWLGERREQDEEIKRAKRLRTRRKLAHKHKLAHR